MSYICGNRELIDMATVGAVGYYTKCDRCPDPTLFSGGLEFIEGNNMVGSNTQLFSGHS